MSRLTRDDWFPVATDLLVAEGHTALTIERLCERAGVTKGSFYHHFGDAAGFRDALLEHLEARVATAVYERVARETTPEARRKALIDAIADGDTGIVGAIRRWAGADEAVAAAVARHEAGRQVFIRELYGSLYANDPARAADMVRLVEAFFLGATLLDPPIRGDEYRRIAALITTVDPARVGSEAPEGPTASHPAESRSTVSHGTAQGA